MTDKSCRTCKWMDATNNAKGVRVAYRFHRYKCLVPLPELPPLPYSVLMRSGPPTLTKSHVEPEDGEECQTWEKFKK